RPLHRYPGPTRRLALARRLWRRPRHGNNGNGTGGRSHGRAVPSDRSQAHAADGAHRGRHEWGARRHRPAGRAHHFFLPLCAPLLSSATLSRTASLESDTALPLAPSPDSLLWWPARAILGDIGALAAVLAASLIVLAAAVIVFAPRFAHHAIAAAGISRGPSR